MVLPMGVGAKRGTLLTNIAIFLKYRGYLSECLDCLAAFARTERSCKAFLGLLRFLENSAEICL